MEQEKIYWSRGQFNSQKVTDTTWINSYALLPRNLLEPTDQYENRVTLFMAETVKNKLRVGELFETEMGIHFRQAASVCEMTFRGDFNDVRKVTRSLHMSQSIANDDSDVNLERLCWILYCSTNTVHKKVFGMEMNDHYEILLMRELGVCYRDGDKGVKGCVSKYYNKMLNEYRTGVRDGMTSIPSCTILKVQRNKPDEVVDPGPKPKKDSPIFWIGKKSDVHQGRIRVKDRERQEMIDMVIWKKVSAKTKIES